MWFRGLYGFNCVSRECGGSLVVCRTPERKIRDSKPILPPPCCVLEQDTLLPENTGNIQDMTEESLTGMLGLNTNKTCVSSCVFSFSNRSLTFSERKIDQQILPKNFLVLSSASPISHWSPPSVSSCKIGNK